MSLKTCPSCSNPLGAPLQSSGRQVCVKCGWSDHPKKAQNRSASSANSSNAEGTVLALSLLIPIRLLSRNSEMRKVSH